MTFGPSNPGAPPPIAPPPGSPPPTAPIGATPSQEDRLLAAAAYVGYFTGFWLVVPIVIYVLKREKSRFVAHHALRALILHVMAVPVFVLSWMFGLVLTFGLAGWMERGGHRHDNDLLSLGIALASILGWVIPWLVYLLVCVLAAVRAFQGRTSTTSLLGRVVERFLGQDKTVAP